MRVNGKNRRPCGGVGRKELELVLSEIAYTCVDGEPTIITRAALAWWDTRGGC